MQKIFTQIFLFIFVYGFSASYNTAYTQLDTLRIQLENESPIVDGVGDDPCWNARGVEWQMIDQLWMPWKGTRPGADDFTGKFKVIWNEEENLLYFLVDIIDDVFIDGYDFETNGPFGYPNYDVVEIFIDEDRSGGPHVFNNGTENAQNAFSYHINVNAPADGKATDKFTVQDLDGTDWGNSWVVNYADHFPDFTMKKTGNNYVYEFSMKVYNDTYPTQNRDGSSATDKELARVTLTEGKIMGMSLAYCDNDANDGKRDHFFGSSPGKEYSANFGFMGYGNSISVENGQKIFNTNWMVAEDYGVVKLVNDYPTGALVPLQKNENISISPTMVKTSFRLTAHSAHTAMVKVEIFKASGMKVAEFTDTKSSAEYTGDFNVEFLNKGIYIVRMTAGNQNRTQKIIKN